MGYTGEPIALEWPEYMLMALLQMVRKAVLLLPYGCGGSTGLRGAKSRKTLFLSDGFDDTTEFTQGAVKYF